jgi:hypothetical protein
VLPRAGGPACSPDAPHGQDGDGSGDRAQQPGGGRQPRPGGWGDAPRIGNVGHCALLRLWLVVNIMVSPFDRAGRLAGVVFVADDLGAWLVAVLADAGRRRLTQFMLGSDQDRALRQAGAAAVLLTGQEMCPESGERAEQLAMVISQVFSPPVPDAPLAGQATTLLESLQAGISAQLNVLDDASLTGTGQSSADLLGISAETLSQTLTSRLVQEILVRGSRTGPLAPLASQLNHDRAYLQGQRLEGGLGQLTDGVLQALAKLERYRQNEIAGHPVSLAPRPPFLVGREDLLAELDARLAAPAGQGPRIAALCGLGGIGKTSVAVEYAHRNLGHAAVVWQFAAEDPAVLAAGFGELAAQLGAGEQGDLRDPVATVHAVLAGLATGWLLIFDNAPDMAAVRAFLPPAGHGQVLITSQNPNWPGQGLDVPVLGTDVAAAFLSDRTGDRDPKSAAALAGELSGLPLALEQAAAYAHATGDSIAGYLALFRQRRPDMLSRGEPTGYRKTVATTWGLAFEVLQQASPGAVGLLRLAAFCAPQAIPLRLLLQSRPGLADQLGRQVAPALMPLVEDALAFRDAIAALRRYSLVTVAKDHLISVHRLVQAVTIDQMPAGLAAEWRHASEVVIAGALAADPKLPGNWPGFSALLPHAQTAVSPHSPGLARVAEYLGRSGSYSAARDLYHKVADAQVSELGAADPETLTTRNGLARWTGQTGDKAGARDMLIELLPVETSVLGPEHPQTLETRSSVARWTGEAGDSAAARDLFAGLLDDEERVLGPEDPETLDTRSALARWTGTAGDPAAARDLFAAALPAEELVLGREHPQTLDTRTCIAQWTGRAGDPASARDMFADLLPVIEQVLGSEHPRALAYRHSFAYWTGQAGDPATARDIFAELLAVDERVLGAEHRQTLATKASLARAARQARRKLPIERDPALSSVLKRRYPDATAS